MAKSVNATATKTQTVEAQSPVEQVTTLAPVVEAPARRGLPKVMINPTAEQVEAMSKMTTSSAKIRYLAAQGYSTKDNLYSGIGTYLGLLTQHVRNVLTQPVKKPS